MDLARLDAAIGGAAAVCALLTCGWLVAQCALTAVSAVPGVVGRLAGRARRVLVPHVVRRAVAGALGVGLLAASPVGAAQESGPFERLRESPEPAAPTVTHSPAAPPTPPSAPAPAPAPPPSLGPRSAVVVVRPGDTLWDIAARRLAAPTPRRIASTWRRWYAANRRVVGADPHLIRPGQRLVPPPESHPRGDRA